MLFQTSDETSTLTRPWDRFLKIVIFLSLEDTHPFTFSLPGLHKKERQKTETSTNLKKGAHPKSWKILKETQRQRQTQKLTSRYCSMDGLAKRIMWRMRRVRRKAILATCSNFAMENKRGLVRWRNLKAQLVIERRQIICYFLRWTDHWEIL